MARSTVYNKITDKEKISLISKDNILLRDDFLNYLGSIDRSPKTIYQYSSDLNIFFVWNLENNNNKHFTEIKKREIVKFQDYVVNNLNWSSGRIRRVKSCLSSLSSYIENILDDEFENFKPLIKKIESPAKETVREKSIIPDDLVDKLLDYLTEKQEYEKACAVAVCAYSGMRKAELLQMKVSFFNDDHLAFDGAMYMTDKIRAKGRGKKGKQISKFILIDAKPYIVNWLNERKKRDINNDFIFTSRRNGLWVERKSVDYWVKEFSNIIGMDFYFHALRHYCCTTMVSKYSLPAEVVKEFFKWESLEMVSLYNDVDVTDSFGKFFTSEGIIKQDSNNDLFK